MNYKKKRIKSELSIFTIAKELGISEEKYKMVEQGKLNLEKEYLDKFLDIMRRSKEINFNRKTKMVKINEWLKSGQAEKDIEKLGYDKYSISTEIGYDSTYVNNMIKSSDNQYCDAKEKLYDFVKNPLNKKIKSDTEEPIIADTKVENFDFLNEWCVSGQAKKDIIDKGYTQIGLSVDLFDKEKSYVNNLLHKRSVGKYMKQKKKLYDFLFNNDNKQQEVIINEVVETNVEPINQPIEIKTDYEIELKSLEEKYEKLNKSCEQLANDNLELLKENQYLKESLKRLFRF